MVKALYQSSHLVVSPSPGAAVLATGAVATVLLVRHTGRRARSFARIVKLITTADRRAARPANAAQFADALQCVAERCLDHAVSRRVLGGNRSSDACPGPLGPASWVVPRNRCRPVRLHAWITVDGQPVGERASTSRYTTLLRIPASRAEADKDTTR